MKNVSSSPNADLGTSPHSPVFVDGTGRRRRRIAAAGYVAAAVCATYVGAVGISVAAGPISPLSDLPLAGSVAGLLPGDQESLANGEEPKGLLSALASTPGTVGEDLVSPAARLRSVLGLGPSSSESPPSPAVTPRAATSQPSAVVGPPPAPTPQSPSPTPTPIQSPTPRIAPAPEPDSAPNPAPAPEPDSAPNPNPAPEPDSAPNPDPIPESDPTAQPQER